MGITPPKWRKRLLIVVLLLLIPIAVLVYFLVPIPGWSGNGKPPNAAAGRTNLSKVELSDDPPHTLIVPNDVAASLAIRKNGKDEFAVAERPKFRRPIELSATALFEPSKVTHIRVPFVPSRTVKIATINTAEGTRELRPGDPVFAKQQLAVMYSSDLGLKKSELIDALVQLKLDKELLENADASAAIPRAMLLQLERNVRTDVNAVNKALNVLEGWKIDPDEIEEVYAEAEEIFKKNGKNGFQFKKYDPTKESKWGRVVLKASADGHIVEANIAEGEVVNDPNWNLFTIANAEKILISANAPEEYLKDLYTEWKERGLKWTVRPLDDPKGAGIEGVVSSISYLVDPNQHTVPIKGLIPNKDRLFRAGQYFTATIELQPPPDVVEIPASAIVNDGNQSIVFIRNPAKQGEYTMRRVMVTHNLDDRVFVRSRLTDREKKPTIEEKERNIGPKEPLLAGEQVILSGLLELKKELEDRESDRGN